MGNQGYQKTIQDHKYLMSVLTKFLAFIFFSKSRGLSRKIPNGFCTIYNPSLPSAVLEGSTAYPQLFGSDLLLKAHLSS